MLTMEKLASFGADTAAGLARCLNNEAFYLRLVNTELGDANFAVLQDALSSGKTQEAFAAAHALKGVLGNLALTPIYEPVAELTELLRNADGQADLGDLPERIRKACAELKALAE